MSQKSLHFYQSNQCRASSARTFETDFSSMKFSHKITLWIEILRTTKGMQHIRCSSVVRNIFAMNKILDLNTAELSYDRYVLLI